MIQATPAFSLTPSKMVFFTRFDRTFPTIEEAEAFKRKRLSSQVKRSSHNFELSAAARKNLSSKIGWLFYMAKKNAVTTYSGKRIHSFKVAFFTFTLPSKQFHNTATITNNLFNHLLTILRTRYGMLNYVWRLEFQKNGNVHYHMVTDCYIDYFAILRVWNKILDANGYIAPYQQKHRAMSLSQYATTYNQSGKIPFPVMAKRYAKGCKHNWSQPPTVDVKSAISNSRIGLYIAKYFNKKEEGAKKCNDLDTEENSANLRLWFCSRSLSKLKTVSDYLFNCDFDIKYINRCLSKAKRVATQYAFCVYFDIQDCTGYARRMLSEILRSYCLSLGYRAWNFST